MSLLDSLTGALGGGGVADAISKATGADPKTVQNAVAIGMPLLLAALAKNSTTSQGAADLHAAVQSGHNGSILDDIKGAVSNPNLTDGQGILGHVLGGNQGAIQSQIAQATGMSPDKVGTVLATVAPVVMGALGKAQQQGNLNAGGLAGLLGGEAATIAQQHPQLGNLTQVLGNNPGVVNQVEQVGSSILGKLFGKS